MFFSLLILVMINTCRLQRYVKHLDNHHFDVMFLYVDVFQSVATMQN